MKVIKKKNILTEFLRSKVEITFLQQSYERLLYLSHLIDEVEKMHDQLLSDKFPATKDSLIDASKSYHSCLMKTYYYVLGEFCTTLYLYDFKSAYKNQTGESINYVKMMEFMVSALAGGTMICQVGDDDV